MTERTGHNSAESSIAAHTDDCLAAQVAADEAWSAYLRDCQGAWPFEPADSGTAFRDKERAMLEAKEVCGCKPR